MITSLSCLSSSSLSSKASSSTSFFLLFFFVSLLLFFPLPSSSESSFFSFNQTLQLSVEWQNVSITFSSSVSRPSSLPSHSSMSEILNSFFSAPLDRQVVNCSNKYKIFGKSSLDKDNHIHHLLSLLFPLFPIKLSILLVWLQFSVHHHRPLVQNLQFAKNWS